jgi:hypothetical protein
VPADRRRARHDRDRAGALAYAIEGHDLPPGTPIESLEIGLPLAATPMPPAPTGPLEGWSR